MEDLKYWIWLSLACTPGSQTFASLLGKFDTARGVYEAEDHEIASAVTSRSRDYESLTDKSLEQAETVLEFCTSKNVGILTYADERYPDSLRDIPTPPVLLYYRGILPDFSSLFTVAVVGTRRLTEYGKKNAFTIAYDLARSGATIVSGMAIGIDAVAHAGALAAGKITVAVIGSGIDVCYPKEHRPLAREIVKAGCVFTEYPPGSRPDGHNFPVRNRIISGLSKVTLVIEGKERSGALLTARHAKEQGRTVYAVPGNVGNPNSEVCNLLLKNGARVCTSADDIVRDFEMSSLGKLNPFELAKKAPVNMSEVLSMLKIACVTQDDPVFKTPRTRTSAKQAPAPQESAPVAEQSASPAQAPDFSGFDAKALKIYKKIPLGGECTIESLADSEMNMRDVMKGLLKLEMGKFITVLPGEKVRRN